MRVAVDAQHLEVEPGNSAALVVEVVNTDDVIDGVTASVLGIPPECVSANPALLPLFPDSTGQVTLDLAVPPSHPAGRHSLTVEVVSHGTAKPPRYVDVDLDVAAQPGLRVSTRPQVVRARRSGRFVIELANYGNVPLDVSLAAADPDRQVQAEFAPPQRRVEAGSVAPILLNVRGPRMIFGSEVDRTVAVEATGRPALGTARPEEAEPDANPAVVRQVTVLLRQRPLISRGLLTVLVLLGIIALWAGTFLLGLAKVFAGDPMTKQAPASFFAGLNNPAQGSGAGSGGSGGSSGSAGAGSGAAPAGALGKSGQLPPGMGGEISGKVLATDDGQPVGRILVQAYRLGRSGLTRMSSAASQADGTYTLAGLFPTDYYLSFSAAGYRTEWYPNRPSPAGAQAVTAIAQGSTSGIDASVTGLPATISGRVDPGNTLTPVTTTVTARPLLGPKTGKAVATARTDGSGNYTLANLPAPNSYELTFTTPGYQASTVTASVAGGDRRLEPAVILGASTGQISGVVRDGSQPLGGARISTTVGGKPLSVLTPTTGQIGAYSLGNLPTPATYVITVADPGHGTTTRIVDLKAGQSRSGLDVNLASGTGSVSGRVVGPDGHGLGGATVSVGGSLGSSGTAPSATTLTAGSPGSFAINGLRVPGSYTLSVTLDGYAAASVPVSLTANGAPPSVTIRLGAELGSITGKVTGTSCAAFPGAALTATNGQRSWSTTSDSGSGQYLITDLDPGSYSVTVTAPGQQQKTALVTVAAGQTQHQDLTFKSGTC